MYHKLIINAWPKALVLETSEEKLKNYKINLAYCKIPENHWQATAAPTKITKLQHSFLQESMNLMMTADSSDEETND